MKLYIVSGLGADYTVLERLHFNTGIEVIFLNWLIPETNESFSRYVQRMADRVDASEPFYLLGYSFGGIIVQEINRLKHARKVVILGSIKSHHEKSKLIRAGELTRIPKILPTGFFNERSTVAYSFFRKLFDPKNPKILQYFRVRDPYYLKWSIDKICDWKYDEDQEVIQIMADRDIVFPLKNSHPDYIIHNATHLFPATKSGEVSAILNRIFV